MITCLPILYTGRPQQEAWSLPLISLGTRLFVERKGLAKRMHATSPKARNPGFTNGIVDRHHVMQVR